MTNLSVRGVDERSLRRLKRDAKRRGISVNRLIADMLNAESGVVAGPAKLIVHDDLDQLAGTWGKPEAREFERVTASFAQIDEGLWR